MTDTLTRLTTALADRYTIERELGAGGMATVYLAHDIKHDRDVAIKVLHPDLGAALGGERFLTEIRTTARLQHPHILPLLDSGEADGLLYYVMPLVTGETLRDRLEREQQLPVDDAVLIAREVADALGYAHGLGVIHRDIKPENILLQGGHALVADFGIALAVQTAGGQRMTQTGLSLGTPQYMSPEQAMGERAIDARSDIYALGAVAYEMLVGEPPFTGPSVQAIVARLVTEEPRGIAAQRKAVPDGVETAVLRALEKLPADRFATAAEFASALSGSGDGTSHLSRARTGQGALAPMRRRLSWPLIAAGVVLAAALGWVLRGNFTRPVEQEPVEFAFQMGVGSRDRIDIAISPDGRSVAKSFTDPKGVTRIMVRDLGSTALTTVQGTEGARDPRFSPDGAWLAFTRNGKLQKVPLAGGPATVLIDSINNNGGAWSVDGEWVFYTKQNDGLWRVPSSGGGTPERLTTLDTARKEFNHWSPDALPGNKAVIFTNYATPISRARIEAVEFATGRRTVLVEGAVYGRYASSGHLLYGRDGAIFAVPFDAKTLKVTGTAVPVMEDVEWLAPDGTMSYDVSDNGTLVYIKHSEWEVSRQVSWVDRSGAIERAIPDSGAWAEPRLSPDGRWITLTQITPKRDLWLYERARGVLTQLTRAPGAAFNAIWAPDSRSVVYTYEDPVYDLHRIPLDGSRPDTLLFASSNDKRALGFSPDGKTLVVVVNIDRPLLALLSLPEKVLTMVDAREASQRAGTISLDGRWLLYEEANLDERGQIFVRPLAGGGRVQVSPDGGGQARWTRGGREIVYRQGDAMMASTFDPVTGEVGNPTTLFLLADAGQLDNQSFGYDVTPDGSRFLMVTPIARPDAQPTHVILNWFETLKAKVKP